MSEFVIHNRAELSEQRFSELCKSIATPVRLSQVLLWCAAQDPQVSPLLQVAQDEYSHDIVVPYKDGLYLVYGAT